MKLDLHVHTVHSGATSIYPRSLIMRESYNSPAGVYARDLVARPATRAPELA